MGGNSPGFFNNGGTRTPNTITARQEGLLNELRSILGREISNEDPMIAGLRQQLLSDTSAESQAMSERMFTEGMLQPALRNFDKEIAPRIGASFANYGGTLSSRRGDALSSALGDVYSNVQAQHAQLLPQIKAFPLSQTLAQIQGFGAINQEKYRPFSLAGQVATTSVKGVTQEQPGPGWQITGDLVKSLASLFAASDRRLKENIVTQSDGRVEFSYTSGALAMGYGRPGRWLGYIAQDLPREDVQIDENGYLLVTNPKYFPTPKGD